MSRQREALQVALDALDCIYSPLHVREINKVGAAMAEIREALVEPEQQPMATVTGWYGGHPVIEPVDGWIPAVGTVLYSAPAASKPLTDAEMRQCANAMDAEPLSEGWKELIKFARAIERAHGIGEA